MPYDSGMDKVKVNIMIQIHIYSVNKLKSETKLVVNGTSF
jgi:hypothetical protein